MDEIGPWMHGVIPDNEDADHDEIRRDVLWGSLMAGAAGVEWYFGAKHPHNDLTSEDWRQREKMWQQTTIARKFFETHLPWREMQSANDLLSSKNGFCLAQPGKVYAIYLPSTQAATIDLSSETGVWTVMWFNPKLGGNLVAGNDGKTQNASKDFVLGTVPVEIGEKDCVALVKRSE
jgi:hypothetical protein